MTLDWVLDELAKKYVFVSHNKVERAKVQNRAMDYIREKCGEEYKRGATLRRVWFDRIDHYREMERERPDEYNAPFKWWEGC